MFSFRNEEKDKKIVLLQKRIDEARDHLTEAITRLSEATKVLDEETHGKHSSINNKFNS